MAARAKVVRARVKSAKPTAEQHKSQLNRQSRKVMGQHYRAKFGVR